MQPPHLTPLTLAPNLRHNCGLVAVANHPLAAEICYFGLHALQHRGQESAGICVSDGHALSRTVGMGRVSAALLESEVRQHRGTMAIGHARYSTTGGCSDANAQPLLVNCSLGQVAIAHNGNLVNAVSIRKEYESRGHIFASTSDTEVILHMLADQAFWADGHALPSVLRHLAGSYCLLIQYPDRIEVARDPSGNRPLCLGQLDGGWIVASETCALDIVDAAYIREVEPGEILTLSASGAHSARFVDRKVHRRAQCVFEHVYFADPASVVFGVNVHEARKRMGRQLAREAPVDADLVIAVPNCARCAALGYHEESGIAIGRGFTTNHYAGRSFIQPSQSMRDVTVRVKLNPIRSSVEGKRLVVVEDSVVRGTTTRGKMNSLRRAGAREIHLRVASPPIRHPCFYGIDFPSREELVASDRTVEQIRQALEVDSLEYLSREGMLACVNNGRPDDGEQAERYCHACFSGDYPIPIDPEFSKDIFERRQLRLL
jgi:amidophosphoribosyltransferase